MYWKNGPCLQVCAMFAARELVTWGAMWSLHLSSVIRRFSSSMDDPPPCSKRSKIEHATTSVTSSATTTIHLMRMCVTAAADAIVTTVCSHHLTCPLRMSANSLQQISPVTIIVVAWDETICIEGNSVLSSRFSDSFVFLSHLSVGRYFLCWRDSRVIWL